MNKILKRKVNPQEFEVIICPKCGSSKIVKGFHTHKKMEMQITFDEFIDDLDYSYVLACMDCKYELFYKVKVIERGGPEVSKPIFNGSNSNSNKGKSKEGATKKAQE